MKSILNEHCLLDNGVCSFQFNSRADLLFLYRPEKVSMGHFKKIEIACINIS